MFPTLGDKQEAADKLVHQLLGTSEPFPEENDPDILALFDDQIFKCSQCDWWCEQDEANESPSGEDICNDCAEE